MQTRSEFVRFLLQKEIVDRREPVVLSKKELAELDAIEAEMRAGLILAVTCPRPRLPSP